MPTKVMIGLDFIGLNFPAALYTIQQWWTYASRSDEHVCTFGISNFCERGGGLPGAHDFTPLDALKTISAFVPSEQIANWTSEIDSELLTQLDMNGVQSRPFYSQFNYGSVVNRLLLLASARDCKYLVRVDPGTLPPMDKSFAELMGEHEAEINSNRHAVVSRQYANRLALRDIFVRQGLEDKHARKVKEFTGIDVRAQVTGGAMLTFRTPGTPAVCFPAGAGLTLVWASDDGIYRVLDETKLDSKMFRLNPVERFDAVGKPKSPKEYYRGILGAVYLKAIRDGGNMDTVRGKADSFIKELADEVLDPKKCSIIDPAWRSTFVSNEIAPEEFVEAIRKGWENHRKLSSEWEKICTILGPVIERETSANIRLHLDAAVRRE